MSLFAYIDYFNDVFITQNHHVLHSPLTFNYSLSSFFLFYVENKISIINMSFRKNICLDVSRFSYVSVHKISPRAGRRELRIILE